MVTKVGRYTKPVISITQAKEALKEYYYVRHAARALGVSASWFSLFLRENGLNYKDYQGNAPVVQLKLPVPEKDLLKKVYLKGRTKYVAEYFKVGLNTAQIWVRENLMDDPEIKAIHGRKQVEPEKIKKELSPLDKFIRGIA